MKSKVGGFVPGFSITIGPLIGEISMNIEIANRLVELRKKSGLSQEELAAKLGLSRQAVSKWERAEASPDTDNLICLAKLYNVSLDDLLNTDQSVDEIVKEQVKPEMANPADGSDGGAKAASGFSQEEKKEGASTASSSSSYKESGDGEKVIIDKTGIHVSSGSDSVHITPEDFQKGASDHFAGAANFHFHEDCSPKEEKRRHRYHVAQEITSSLVSLLAVVAYVLLGCLYPDPYIGWGVCWLVFLAIPLATSFVEALAKRRFSVFAFPVLVAGLYAMVGMVFHLWHPTWVMFLAIPLYYAIFGPLDQALRKHDERKGIVIDIANADDEKDGSETNEEASASDSNSGQ